MPDETGYKTWVNYPTLSHGASCESSQPFRETYVLRLAVCRRLPFSGSPSTGRSVIGLLASYHGISTIISRFYAVLQPDTCIGLEQSQDFTCLTASLCYPKGVMSSSGDGIMNIYNHTKQSESFSAKGSLYPHLSERDLAHPLNPRELTDILLYWRYPVDGSYEIYRTCW